MTTIQNMRVVVVPDGLKARFERQVDKTAQELGITQDEALRLVEVAILQRGLAAMETA